MKKAIIAAVSELAILRYFPSDPGAREAIMRLLERMVSTPAELRWLVDAMVDQVGEWQGPHELRGVFCSRFAPKDGVEADCAAGVFSPAALENRSAVAHSAIQGASGELRRIEGATSEEEPVSGDPGAESLVSELAHAKAMPKVGHFVKDQAFRDTEEKLRALGL